MNPDNPRETFVVSFEKMIEHAITKADPAEVQLIRLKAVEVLKHACESFVDEVNGDGDGWSSSSMTIALLVIAGYNSLAVSIAAEPCEHGIEPRSKCILCDIKPETF